MLSILLSICFLLHGSAAINAPIRLCAPGPQGEKRGHCTQMEKDLLTKNLRIHCIEARDRYQCLEFLISKYVDVALVDPEDVYIAQTRFDAQLSVLGQTRVAKRAGDAFRYEAVAVVRRKSIKSLDDLRGSKSCHTGYRRTAGWHIPISHLLDKGIMPKQCSTSASVSEHDLSSASSFFDSACIPGTWAPDQLTDQRLKLKYGNLCTLCANPSQCSGEDIYSGYEGSLECLVKSGGDVAWTKASAAETFFLTNENATKEFGYLCPDGRVHRSDKKCRYAARPWPTWLVQARNSEQANIQKALERALEAGTHEDGSVRPWATALFGAKEASVFESSVASASPTTPEEYLNKQAGYGITISRSGCPETTIKLCIEDEASKRKCNALAKVLESRRVKPPLACVLSPDSQTCASVVAMEDAHVAVVGSGGLFDGLVENNLETLLSERYNLMDVSYYAVAVIKADSKITSLEELKGTRSCHTGAGRTAGWKVPIATFLSTGIFSSSMCDYPKALAKFFSSSCIPGIKEEKYDPKGTNPTSLCALCAGKEEIDFSPGFDKGTTYTLSGKSAKDKCSASDNEMYYGYSGALRCLIEGGGDVAFIKHSTVGDNTRETSNATWAQKVHPEDLRLLCPSGGVAPVTDFERCHWAKVPPQKLMVRKNLPENLKEDIRILFISAANLLPRGQDVFAMFGSFQGKNNLIFKDTVTEFTIPRQNSPDEVQVNFLRVLEDLESCGRTSSESITDRMQASKCNSVYGELSTILLILFFTYSINLFNKLTRNLAIV